MQTKITLIIDGEDKNIGSECIFNWEQILCNYKRADFGGIVRSFTSEFEFVGLAYDILVDEFMRKRFDSDAKVAISLIDDDWNYHKAFECPLDFSTAKFDEYTFKVSAVDNSLAALLNACKGIKYDFVVGADIEPDSTFRFDRLMMTESVTYGFTYGTTNDETGYLAVSHPTTQSNIWIGSLAHETFINQAIAWNDDQEDEDSGYALSAIKRVGVKLDYSAVVSTLGNNGNSIRLNVQRVGSTGVTRETFNIGTFGGADAASLYLGEFASVAALPTLTGSTNDGKYAVVNGIVYRATYKGVTQLAWVNTELTRQEYCREEISGSHTFTLAKGDKIRFRVAAADGSGEAQFIVVSSSFKFSWQAKGDMCEIDAITPHNALNRILSKIGQGKLNISGEIDGYDERIARTYLLAAESIRGIEGAKFTSSFSDFKEWMEAVFGYVYTLGDVQKSNISSPVVVVEAAEILTTPYHTEACLVARPDAQHVCYNSCYGKFVAINGQYYHCFPGDEEYNDPETGLARTDRLFLIKGKYYYFESGDFTPKQYIGEPQDACNDRQTLRFVHRSTLFNADAPIKDISDAKDIQISVNQSAAYSTIEVGYSKKDYDSVNGRDEFNFTNTYTTGYTLGENKLSLISKYRADSYGIEFAAQKRGADTSDNNGDKDVFFVLCEQAGREVSADRTAVVEGAASDTVFNASFSPMNCCIANGGYICLQADEMTLAYASADGNDAVTIDGVGVSSDISLSDPLMTNIEMEFATADLELPSLDSLIRVVSDGIEYHGFIKEVQEGYGRECALKYKLYIKQMQLC